MSATEGPATRTSPMAETHGNSAGGLRPVTVVTGGSDGIGLALARRFARAGHPVALVARRPEPLAQAAAALRSQGAAVVELAFDVGDPGAPAALETALMQRGYFIDVLINCAGLGLAGPFTAHSQQDLLRLIETNITGLTRLMRHVLPAMVARRHGGVLNVASLGGYMPGPYQAAYYASKAYVLALSEAVDHELAGTGVRVVVLAPGPVDSRFHARMGAQTALYRLVVPSMSPTRVASAGYWGFRLGRRVIVPGVLWPLSVLATRLLPHMLLIPVMGLLLRPRPAEGTNVRGKGGG